MVGKFVSYVSPFTSQFSDSFGMIIGITENADYEFVYQVLWVKNGNFSWCDRIKQKLKNKFSKDELYFHDI